VLIPHFGPLDPLAHAAPLCDFQLHRCRRSAGTHCTASVCARAHAWLRESAKVSGQLRFKWLMRTRARLRAHTRLFPRCACVHVRACVCVRVRARACLRARVSVCMRACVCVCVCVRVRHFSLVCVGRHPPGPGPACLLVSSRLIICRRIACSPRATAGETSISDAVLACEEEGSRLVSAPMRACPPL
jgi:hypothetical protein